MQTQQTFLSKYKSLLILSLDFVFMLVLIKILPFSSQENRGLALLIFIGILWLTEAFNITVTSLMVPVVAIGLGLINTQKALAPFSTPNYLYVLWWICSGCGVTNSESRQDYCELHYSFGERKLKTFYHLSVYCNHIPFYVD